MPEEFRPSDFARLAPPAWGSTPSSILRHGTAPYSRSPYALEFNPWVSREDWETLLLLRGSIVASFGQIETNLAELALRFSSDARCKLLKESYPQAIERRISFLRSCFKIEPYCRRAGLAEQVFRRFEKSAALRHVMAHGRVKHPVSGWITFRDFRPKSPGEVLMRDHRFTFVDMETHAYSSARLARRVTSLIAKIDAAKWLPGLEALS